MVAFFLYLIPFIVSSHLAATVEVGGPLDSNIHLLREMGRLHLNSKDYRKAAEYYSAVLQSIEKETGSISEELRRRCSLTLAECEIQSGKLFHAIARCSDILNDCPDPDGNGKIINSFRFNKTEGLQNVMSKALYRRGLSLMRLNKPHLAVIDLNTSLQLKPDDKLVKEKLATAKKESSFSLESVSTSSIGEELEDLIEECQVNYPRTTFSREQLDALVSPKNTYNPPSIWQQQKQQPDLFGDFGSSGMNTNLNDLFGGGIGGGGSPFGGGNFISDMISNSFGGGSGGGSVAGGVKPLLSMLTTFNIIDVTTASRLEALLAVATKVTKKFQQMKEVLAQHRHIFLFFLNALIVLVTFWQYRGR